MQVSKISRTLFTFAAVKRLFLLISAFLYLATASGANLYYHYCGGELAGWGFEQPEAKECSSCGMEKGISEDNGCCKDKQVQVKLTVDQKQQSADLFKLPALTATLPTAFFTYTSPLLLSLRSDAHPAHAPPRSSSIALHIKHCHFRI